LTILVSPTTFCNLNCKYCYITEKDNKIEYDLNKILESMNFLYNSTKDKIAFHGGEILTLPIDDLEILFKRAYEIQGNSSIQTNLLLLNEKHIELFKKYNVGVGVSIDGFEKLNSLRCSEEETKKVVENILKLLENKVKVSIITVLHKINSSYERINELLKFIQFFTEKGISFRLNFMGAYTEEAKKYELSENEAVEVYLKLVKEFPQHYPFQEMREALENGKPKLCIFSGCDPFHTTGGQVISSHGEIVCCGRHKKFLRTNIPSKERVLVLAKTDCKGCRFFNICNGGCSSLGIDNDWRNKDRFCKAYYSVFCYLEKFLNKKFDYSFKEEKEIKILKSAWKSEYLKEYWDKKIDEITKDFYYAQLKSVASGFRDCATIHIDGKSLNELKFIAENNLVLYPIRKIKPFIGFAHVHQEPKEGEPSILYCVVSRSIEKAKKFAELENSYLRNHVEIGKLLGYPECCSKFFQETFHKNYDYIPEIYKNSKDFYPELNILIRYWGIRLIPFFPCRFDCENALDFAIEFKKFMKKENYENLIKILGIKTIWDSYKGLVQVENNIFIGVTDSYYLDKRVVVNYEPSD